jgi:hypothetical protein
MSKKQANQESPIITPDKAQDPPQAPDIPRQWILYNYQYIAIPLLLLIPVLALFGVLGETSTTVEAAGEGIALRVHYPDRAHYEAYNHVEVTVRNESGADISGVMVEFERELLDHFSQLSVNPSLTEITETAYRVELGDIGAGEERLVTLDYQPDMNGAHESWVRLTADGIEPVQADFSMFVFP